MQSVKNIGRARFRRAKSRPSTPFLDMRDFTLFRQLLAAHAARSQPKRADNGRDVAKRRLARGKRTFSNGRSSHAELLILLQAAGGDATIIYRRQPRCHISRAALMRADFPENTLSFTVTA